jgi:glutathione peroxidase
MILKTFLLFSFFFSPKPEPVPTPAKTIYEYKVAGLTGGTIDLSQYKGKKILIVNTASQCGYTPQYEGLEKLAKKYAKTLVIIGFPANNFGAQEPGTNEDIKAFCSKNYGVTFPMAAKISVKGSDMAPIYHWLTEKAQNGVKESDVKWNFQKYLINEKGALIDVYMSNIAPDNSTLIKAIEG